MHLEDIKQRLREGELTPEEAVHRFEIPAVHIKDISTKDLNIDVIPCGLPTLDDYMLLKSNRSELIILGARPSMGKSALLFQIARNVAKNTNDKAVLAFSLEMDKESLLARDIAAMTSTPLQRIQQGQVSQQVLSKAHAELSKLHLYIDDRPRLTIHDIVGSARALAQKTDIGMLVIDYLQLIKIGGGDRRSNRHEELGDITGELKALGKELKCPIIAASQLSRACEQRGNDKRGDGDYRPMLSDLRDSGNLEQDADMVLFLSREAVYNGTRQGEADIGVAKNKNGKTGWEVFRWLSTMTKFEDPKEGQIL